MQTLIKSITVFVGSGMSSTPWYCIECFRRCAAEASFEVEQPVIDTAGPPSRRVKNSSRKRELQVAKDIGGRRQPGSGSTPFAKGDVRKKGDLRVELKDCYSNTFGLTIPVLDKIRSECSPGEQPALVVTFREKHTHQERESWVVIPYETWEENSNAVGKHR